MSKKILFSFVVIALLSGCGKEKAAINMDTYQEKYQTNFVQVIESGTTYAKKFDADSETYGLDDYANLLGMEREDVIDKIGLNYMIKSIGVSKLDTGIYYESFNVGFFLNKDKTVQYIEYNGNDDFMQHKHCTDFASIKEEYGDCEIEKYHILEDGTIQEDVFDEASTRWPIMIEFS